MANVTANMTVQTSDVTTAKNSIREYAEKLKGSYQKVFDDYLVKIDNAWDGDDNTEFNTRKASFRKDFELIDDFLTSLQTFLENVVTQYEDAETATKQQAQNLAK